MRKFREDPSPHPGWSVDWALEDRYKFLPRGSDVHPRYTDLTSAIQAYICEGWITMGGYNSTDQAWIPRVLVQRQGPGPLVSTFLGVIEPYENASNIAAIRRVRLETADVEYRIADGKIQAVRPQDAARASGEAAPSTRPSRRAVSGTRTPPLLSAGTARSTS
jgi:hypothetical protein